MNIGNTMNFIKRGINGRDLQVWLNSALNLRRRDDILTDECLQFADHEY